jgi:putative flippase GtrA
MTGVSTPTRITTHAVRYAIAGATVFGTYVACTLLFSGPLGIPIAIAIAIAYVLSVSLHFCLQRFFVFRDRTEFALATHHQIGRYIVIGGVQYCITATLTAVLPGWLGVSEQIVYVCSAFALSGGVFLLLRGGVFHAA